MAVVKVRAKDEKAPYEAFSVWAASLPEGEEVFGLPVVSHSDPGFALVPMVPEAFVGHLRAIAPKPFWYEADP